jgi:KaiC/GvpD/RAD55 family RecA-like ATPase
MLNEQDGMSKVQRIRTGIQGLDNIIQGGFPKNSITLVSGPPGGGKSIFCFQFLWEGVKNGEKCLFLSLDKKPEGLLAQAKELGFDFQSAIDQGTAKFEFLNINNKLVYETMTNEIMSNQYDRVVLDSITPLSEMPIYIRNPEDFEMDTDVASQDNFPSGTPLPTRRLHLRYIMNALESSECTSIVTSELPSGSNLLSRDGISEFLADGVITLGLDPNMDRRKLSVMKMRNTKHTLKPQNIAIDTGGIKMLL